MQTLLGIRCIRYIVPKSFMRYNNPWIVVQFSVINRFRRKEEVSHGICISKRYDQQGP